MKIDPSKKYFFCAAAACSRRAKVLCNDVFITTQILVYVVKAILELRALVYSSFLCWKLGENCKLASLVSF